MIINKTRYQCNLIQSLVETSYKFHYVDLTCSGIFEVNLIFLIENHIGMNMQTESSDDDTLPDEYQMRQLAAVDHHIFNDSFEEVYSNQHANNIQRLPDSQQRIGNLRKLFNGIFDVIRGAGKCLCRCLKYLGNNKFMCFMFFQMIFVFLRLTGINAQLIFWLTFIPTLTILFFCLCHFFITAQRTQDEQNRVTARRRHRPINEFNDQLMQQLILHALRQRLELILADQRLTLANLQRLQIPGQRLRMPSLDMMRELFFEIGIIGEQPQNNQIRGLPEAQINNLPVEIFHKENENAESESCSICIDEYEQNHSLKKLPCGHRFHIKCIDEWLRISNSCPNCKAEIPRENIVPDNQNLDNDHYILEEP